VLSDLGVTRENLLEELAHLDAPAVALDEPLVETISPRGLRGPDGGNALTVLRANLRPFAARGLDPEKLLTAMVETSLLLPVRGAEPLEAVWPTLLPVLIDDLKIPAADVEAFAREIELGRYPPVHHSQAYRRAYAPHYRVVVRRVWKREFGDAGL
jgi:hypothetical protein